MARRTMRKGLVVVGILGVFATGYVCGSLTQQSAEAQLKDAGKAVMQQAGQSGGTLGAAADMGSSLTEMQDHVNGLQKNIDTLKKVQSALGMK